MLVLLRALASFILPFYLAPLALPAFPALLPVRFALFTSHPPFRIEFSPFASQPGAPVAGVKGVAAPPLALPLFRQWRPRWRHRWQQLTTTRKKQHVYLINPTAIYHSNRIQKYTLLDFLRFFFVSSLPPLASHTPGHTFNTRMLLAANLALRLLFAVRGLGVASLCYSTAQYTCDAFSFLQSCFSFL